MWKVWKVWFNESTWFNDKTPANKTKRKTFTILTTKVQSTLHIPNRDQWRHRHDRRRPQRALHADEKPTADPRVRVSEGYSWRLSGRQRGHLLDARVPGRWGSGHGVRDAAYRCQGERTAKQGFQAYVQVLIWRRHVVFISWIFCGVFV